MGLRVGGLQSGIDTNALIEALVAAERRPLDLVEQRKSGLEQERSLYRDLNTRLLALRDAAAAIDNVNSTLSAGTLDEEFLSFQATSGDPAVVTATATGNASPGNVDVNVTALATVGRRFSEAVADSSAIIANAGETLQISYGGETDITITVGAGGASLENLRDAINGSEDNDGSVIASILFDGTNSRLVIAGRETGLANDVVATSTISGGAFIDGLLDQVASDASFSVFGVPMTRDTNDVSDVLPGLTFRLQGQSVDALTPTTINVERDDESIFEKVEAFTTAYNAVVDFIELQASFDETTERAGPLSGDPTLRGIQSTIQGLVSREIAMAGNPLSTLGQIGIEVGRSGRLGFDSAALTAALDEDPFAVRELLSSGVDPDDPELTVDGAALAFARAIDPITLTGTGTLALRDDAIEEEIAGLDRQIDRFEARLERREELLVLQFSRLESTIAALQSQGNSLLSLVTPQT